MENRIDVKSKLDFSEMDLTAPDIVVDGIFAQLPGETNGLIFGSVQSYDGHIESYKTVSLSAISEALGATKEVNIQNSLGAVGEECKKFECYLYTNVYDHYKYRLFFMEYNAAHYPVKLVVEQSIVNSMYGGPRNYIFSCDSREILEEFVLKILTCKKTIGIMQELIRIAQAKNVKNAEEDGDGETLEN